ncbi:cysteine proteinase [Rhizoclosmatium globosum]|uniref:ubiquitinyl hydrolase 1 n=1 Tax=Rhizoclosmatium globosum TaxID=329046 RepID=A0A1Y2C4D8_9FUNG|nr:cysteine proteinase [Rhizoclosmatium globosum]|eukprot:ORY41889.1 cysteine proteinase [Rhizoclosmatium globosum]
MADFAPPAEQATAPLTPGSDPMDAEPHIPVPKLSDMASLVPQLANCETEAEFVYRWSITDWKEKKRTNKVYSPTFEFNGAQWRILVFPNGNNGGDTLAVFLDSVTAAEQPKDSNWHMCLSFAIAVSNPDDDDVFKHMSANHRYNPHELDWGFNHLVKLNALALPLEGQTKSFLVDDERLVISVHMRAIKDETGILWHNFQHYDSKKVTGFVGLKNQGATCYMNSLLQSLYFINYFRKATFNIPTENDEPTKSIPLALQRVFYQLQFSDQSVGTIELTKSFGWDTLDSFMQHDVQEFNRVLQDNLESKMKGTKAEGAISRLFVGKYKSYIKCINVNFESSRIEDFYDIQLNVKGFKTLHDSFVDYIAVETMDGDNQYRAEGHGLQDAKKGVIFTEFPPVLHLQLKRFEYDMEKDAMVKINDRYEFPNEIDLAPFLDPSSPQKGPQKYLLHGVLVHAGDLTGGHYCAFLRSEKNGKWFKFDDDRVTPVTDKDATEENFGVDSNTKTKLIKRFTNAYMLVYVRENASDEILKPIETEDIPEHLRQRFEEERLATEQKRRDREEQHFGFDLCNLDDKALPLSEIKSLKIRKEEKFGALREQLAITLNTPVERVKIWSMVHRQNKTVRVDTLITSDEKTVEQVRESLKITSELRLYIDTESIAPSDPNSILIFIKRYDPLSGTIRVAGKCFFSRTQKLQDAIPDILDIAGIQGPNIKVFEEVKPTMIDEVDLSKTFTEAELGTGDILCVQNVLPADELAQLPDPRTATITHYFEDYRNRMTVIFKHKNKEKETPLPDLELVLSKRMNYDAVVAKLGPKVNWDSAKIQLFSQQGSIAKLAIKRSSTLTLQEMTNVGYYVPPGSTPTTLHYELLDIPLSELETKRFVKIVFIDRQQHESDPIDFLVSKTGVVDELLKAVGEKVQLSQSGSGKLRLFEVHNFRPYKTFGSSDYISIIGESANLYAEEIPVEELEATETDVVVNVCHFTKDTSRGHGVPFRFVVKQGEIFSAAKARMITTLGIAEKDAVKMKFFWVPSMQRPKPIEDDDILSDVIIGMGNLDYLGIDHVDRSGKSSKGGAGGAIKIFN